MSEPPQGQVFGRVADLYHRTRLRYPDEMFERLVAPMGPELLVVDAGVGTGLSSRWFLEAGHRVVGVDPSAEMAAVAREQNRDVGVRFAVVVAELETWEGPGEPADLVVSGQAWHWMDPLERFVAARRLLREGGSLAVFWNRPDQDVVPFAPQIAAIYERLAPDMGAAGTALGLPGTKAAVSAATPGDEIEAAPQFGEVRRIEVRWSHTMTTDEHCDALHTQSDHLLLAPAVLEELVGEVRAVIDGLGGSYELPVTTTCWAALAD